MMPPRGRKHRRSLPPDMFTNLPDNVIDLILMFLPCKDAVRTSILSKKWRYNWCRLTKPTLDTSLWETKKDFVDPVAKFTKIIDQILTLHLVLENLELLNAIEINAPMLRSFNFKGYISSLCLKNVPLLAKLSLIGKDSYEADYVDFANLLEESCPALEHILLDFWYAELFMESRAEAPARLPFDINSVTRFYLPHIMLMDSYGLSCALCCIRSFPYLEYLEIQVYHESGDDLTMRAGMIIFQYLLNSNAS
ncbi:hypothetical protein T459_29183 [Capsicum annuum]|uniref:F-box domain-containing protein n=1 Tax=Capsicum annuum TaxID=4072 RepID=A0A2G2Y4V5_CAPAN|nr:putative F-box/FBD/LRR-repeat protein-like isoform X2 [Capsicum annuum]PHT64758.1 hypothetical protein T459_29183 [Capsicum annuum]